MFLYLCDFTNFSDFVFFFSSNEQVQQSILPKKELSVQKIGDFTEGRSKNLNNIALLENIN